ncbi:hypothetical protein CC78DRAFT_530868, partial [Lojkania enalia]
MQRAHAASAGHTPNSSNPTMGRCCDAACRIELPATRQLSRKMPCGSSLRAPELAIPFSTASSTTASEPHPARSSSPRLQCSTRTPGGLPHSIGLDAAHTTSCVGLLGSSPPLQKQKCLTCCTPTSQRLRALHVRNALAKRLWVTHTESPRTRESIACTLTSSRSYRALHLPSTFIRPPSSRELSPTSHQMAKKPQEATSAWPRMISSGSDTAQHSPGAHRIGQLKTLFMKPAKGLVSLHSTGIPLETRASMYFARLATLVKV